MSKLIDDEKTDLAKVEAPLLGSLVAAGAGAPVAEVLRDGDGRAVGVEIETNKLEVPRLALVQKQSRVTDENLAQPGQLLSTLLMESLWPLPQHQFPKGSDLPDGLLPFAVPGADPPTVALPFLPLRAFVDQVMFNDKFSLVCRSLPGGLRTVQGFRSPAWQEGDAWDPTLCSNCPLKDWGPNSEKPECGLTYNIIGFALDIAASDVEGMLGMPMAVTFANSSAKTGRTMATNMKMSGKNPWAYIWLLWNTMEKNDMGSFYVWRAQRAKQPGTAKALPTPPELYEYAAAMFANLVDRPLDIDRETAADAAHEVPAEGAVGTEGAVWDDEGPQA
jgi:hypothetical protein